MSGSGNPLITALGVQFLKANDGPTLAVRPALLVSNAALRDVPARRTVQVTPNSATRVRIDVALPTGDYEFLDPDDWAIADDVYITAEADVRIAGFGFADLVKYRKLIINAGTEPIDIFNFLLADDDPDWDTPGHIMQSAERLLQPGDSCRVQWDPTGQLWLVNDGMYSGDLITHDNALVTEDADNVTVF